MPCSTSHAKFVKIATWVPGLQTGMLSMPRNAPDVFPVAGRRNAHSRRDEGDRRRGTRTCRYRRAYYVKIETPL